MKDLLIGSTIADKTIASETVILDNNAMNITCPNTGTIRDNLYNITNEAYLLIVNNEEVGISYYGAWWEDAVWTLHTVAPVMSVRPGAIIIGFLEEGIKATPLASDELLIVPNKRKNPDVWGIYVKDPELTHIFVDSPQSPLSSYTSETNGLQKFPLGVYYS